MLDVILLLLLFGFIFFGFWTGLIHALGGLVGAVVGAAVASRVMIPLGQKWAFLVGGNENLAKILVFIIVFVVVNRLVGLLFFIIEKVFHIISVIPFLKTINRLGGAVFGFVEGVLVIGVTIYVASRFPVGDAYTAALQSSQVARKLVEVSAVITPLLPVILRELRSVIGI